jgi:phosphohistidine swiveling domain-containing protein
METLLSHKRTVDKSGQVVTVVSNDETLQRICSGQIITVDGSAGVVLLGNNGAQRV